MIYRGERGKPIAGLGGYQMFDLLAVEASGNVCVATLISGCISVIAPDGTLGQSRCRPATASPPISPSAGPELKTAYITLSGKGELIAMDWRAARPAAEFFEQVMIATHTTSCEERSAKQSTPRTADLVDCFELRCASWWRSSG